MYTNAVVEHSVAHGNFTVDRTYKASPARVFAAFADKALKEQWFHGPEGWANEVHEMDFRVGGREYNMGRFHGGDAHPFDATYYDIVPNERIVYAYAMYVGEERSSVSLATIELEPTSAGGTLLTWTEQGAFLDGLDLADQRVEGTKLLMEQIAIAVDRA